MKTKRFTACLLSLVLLFSNLPIFRVEVNADNNKIKFNNIINEDNLENIAADCEIIVLSEQSGKPKSNMVDGKLDTLWVNNGSKWPSDIKFKLPKTRVIKKVEIEFEKVADRKVDISLSKSLTSSILDSI